MARPVEPTPLPLPAATAVAFSESVRSVVNLARSERLRPPVFRSPPSIEGIDRSIRRRPTGSVTVAVRRVGRPLAAVQADIIEGVVVANRLDGTSADGFRHRAWSLLDPSIQRAEPARVRRVA